MSMWDDFDAQNMTDDQRDALLGDVYGGYKQTNPKPVYAMKGAGSGRAMRQVGTKTTTNYDAYENHPAWSKIAKEKGISGAIDNRQELGAMADYVVHFGKDKGGPEVPEEVAPEETPETAEPIIASKQATDAQNFANNYKSSLLNSDIYKSAMQSYTPNMNTQGENVLGAYESNTFSDPEFTQDKGAQAADDFLKAKKLELNSGLTLV